MILRNSLRYQIPPHTIVDKSYWLFKNALMQSLRLVLKLQMTILCTFVRLRNVSIYCKLQKKIFQSQLYLTKYTSKNTSKTLDFLSDVRKVKYKERQSHENRQSHEAIKVQMDMSHMRYNCQTVEVFSGTSKSMLVFEIGRSFCIELIRVQKLMGLPPPHSITWTLC